MKEKKTLFASQQALLKQYEKLLVLHGKSASTRKDYKRSLKKFLIEIQPRMPTDLQPIELLVWGIEFSKDSQMGSASFNMLINAVNFYYKYLANKLEYTDILPRIKKKDVSKIILSKGEIQYLFNNIRRSKMRCILALLYGLGLRTSELVAIQLDHLDKQRKRLYIRNGQMVIDLSDQLLGCIEAYSEEYKPTKYLFFSQRKEFYTSDSISTKLRELNKRRKLVEKLTPTVLRDSFIVHALEQRVDQNYLEELLGFKQSSQITPYRELRNHCSTVFPLDNQFFRTKV